MAFQYFRDHVLPAGIAHLCDDGCAVLLRPDGGGALVGSSATSLTPTTFCHPRRHQAGGAGGQVIAARANQRNLCDLGWKRARDWAPDENRSGSARLGSDVLCSPCFLW